MVQDFIFLVCYTLKLTEFTYVDYIQYNVYYIQHYVLYSFQGSDFMVKRKKIFNTKIKVLRAEKDLTQEDLAIDLGVNRSTILEIERGTFNPSLKLSFKIAKYFGKTVDEIFEMIEKDEE